MTTPPHIARGANRYENTLTEIARNHTRTNPGTLYRFRNTASDYFEMEMRQLITDGRAYFPAQSQLNDPFDCLPVVRRSPDFSTFHRKIFPILTKLMLIDAEDDLRRGGGSYQRLHEMRALHGSQSVAVCRGAYETFLDDDFVDKLFRRAGVLSLTRSSENFVLWGTYARNSEGLCVEFSGADEAAPYGSPMPVIYSDDRPVFDYYGYLWAMATTQPYRLQYLTDREWVTAVRGLRQIEAMYRKHTRWAYEEEFRIAWFFGGGEYIPIKPLCLSKLIFGWDVNDLKVLFVRDLIKQSGSSVEVLFARPSDDGYAMRFSPSRAT